MPKGDNIEAEGTVVECLRNAMFKVKLNNGGMEWKFLLTFLVKSVCTTLRFSKATP